LKKKIGILGRISKDLSISIRRLIALIKVEDTLGSFKNAEDPKRGN